MTSKVIIPGLVDTHSRTSASSGAIPAAADSNEMTGPVPNPGLRAHRRHPSPNDPGIRHGPRAAASATANIMPGSGNVIGGQTASTFASRGPVVEAHAPSWSRTRMIGGIKFANGENPKGVYGTKGQAARTRMKIAALQREMLTKAVAYKRPVGQLQGNGKQTTAPRARHQSRSACRRVLERKRTASHFHCHRRRRHHDRGAYTSPKSSASSWSCSIAPRAISSPRRTGAAAAFAVSLTLVDSPGGKPEVMGLLEENAAILTKAGVKVAINTDDSVTEITLLPAAPALPIALRVGLVRGQRGSRPSRCSAAQMLHLDERVGSLDKGKDADFVVLSGSPFSVYTQVLETYIEGEKMLPITNVIHEDWTYQAGGFALAKNEKLLPKTTAAIKPMPAVKTPPLPKGALKPMDQPKKLAILAGRIHTVGKNVIESGIIFVENGKITLVSSRAQDRDSKGLCGCDGRCRDAGFDRRPLRRRAVRCAQLQERRPGSGRDERSEPGRFARHG